MADNEDPVNNGGENPEPQDAVANGNEPPAEPNKEEEECRGPFACEWEDSDVVVLVEGRKLHVHSMILSFASQPLKKLSSKSKEIDLTGHKYELVEAMLMIIYPNSFFTFAGKSIDFLKGLLSLSQHYAINCIITKIKDHVDILCKDLTLHGETDQLQALHLLTLSDAGNFSDAIKICAVFIGPKLYYNQVPCTELKNYNGTFEQFCQANPTLQIKTKLNVLGEIMKHKLSNVGNVDFVNDMSAMATYFGAFNN